MHHAHQQICHLREFLKIHLFLLDFAGPPIHQLQWPTICLYTCAATRAVHLELVQTLGVESFLLSFQRFVGRRGLPATLISDNAKTLISDNAKTFQSSSKEISKVARSSRYLTNNHTSWKFIAEKAPWWGGFWEHVIQSVKQSLKEILG